MQNPMSATAYKRKDELGGGYRGIVIDKRSTPNQRYESKVCPTIEEARHYARLTVQSLMNGRPWKPGYLYKPYWTMHVWTKE